MARSRRTPAMLVGRCSWELSGRKLQRNIKNSQTPSKAEWRDPLFFPLLRFFHPQRFLCDTPLALVRNDGCVLFVHRPRKPGDTDGKLNDKQQDRETSIGG